MGCIMAAYARGNDASASEAEEGTLWTPVVGEAREVNQSPTRRWRLPVLAVMGMAAGVLLVVALWGQVPGTVRTSDDPHAEDFSHWTRLPQIPHIYFLRQAAAA